MEAFKRELSIYEKDRQELANAEKLFDLSITMYPELLQVQKEMTGLDKIYEIYKQQKVSARMGFLRGFSWLQDFSKIIFSFICFLFQLGTQPLNPGEGYINIYNNNKK